MFEPTISTPLTNYRLRRQRKRTGMNQRAIARQTVRHETAVLDVFFNAQANTRCRDDFTGRDPSQKLEHCRG